MDGFGRKGGQFVPASAGGRGSLSSRGLDEIRKERVLGAEDGGDFPPCRVEIVLGAKGRLYVVLPTGVETALPFACNGPFIEDPARLKIKDPETSPTNRWLLNRSGELAASAMMEWLDRPRPARGIGLTPMACCPTWTAKRPRSKGPAARLSSWRSPTRSSSGDPVDGGWRTGRGRGRDHCSSADIRHLASRPGHGLVRCQVTAGACQHVSFKDRTKLIRWALVEEFSKADLLQQLRSNHLPRSVDLAAPVEPLVLHCARGDELAVP